MAHMSNVPFDIEWLPGESQHFHGPRKHMREILKKYQLSGQTNIADFLSTKGFGGNTYVIIVANEDYQSYSRKARQPEIILTEPLLKVVETKELSSIIKGRVESDCNIDVVPVNGQEAHSLPDGSFVARVALEAGENKIAIEAKNCAWWTTDYINFITPVIAPGEQAEETNDSSITGELKESGKNYTIIIGISKYNDPVMPDLFYPVKDAMKLKEILLANYNFETRNVFLLENPTKERIIKTLDSLSRIITSEDNLLIFYAGHGSWDEKTSMGYWLPSDAAARVYDNWLINSIITSYVSQCKAKHTLVIADACFGGSTFRTRAFKPEEEKTASELYSKTSKKAMTSDDLTEVPDKSVFV